MNIISSKKNINMRKFVTLHKSFLISNNQLQTYISYPKILMKSAATVVFGFEPGF